MGEDAKLFDQRITLLKLSPTLAPDVTIRDAKALCDTIAAPSSDLPRISFDIDRQASFADNLWVEAMTVAAAAIAYQPRLWLALPPIVLGATLAPMVPDKAGGIFAIVSMMAFALIAFALWPKAQSGRGAK